MPKDFKKREMKGSLTLKLLEAILAGARVTGDIITTVLESGYGASYGTLNRNLQAREAQRAQQELRYQERQRFHSTLYKLKRDGFLVHKVKRWHFTSRGREKLEKLQRRYAHGTWKREYPREKSSDVMIVAFDVPEKEKGKRDWLRATLLGLGFTALQKSVFYGNTKLPEELMNDLDTLKLLPHLHILSVHKSGTIRERQQ